MASSFVSVGPGLLETYYKVNVYLKNLWQVFLFHLNFLKENYNTLKWVLFIIWNVILK
jgi:hypothetical protein